MRESRRSQGCASGCGGGSGLDVAAARDGGGGRLRRRGGGAGGRGAVPQDATRQQQQPSSPGAPGVLSPQRGPGADGHPAIGPRINQQLVAASQAGNLQLLVSTVEAYLPQMNLVNLCTGLHRLAKVTAGHARLQTTLREMPLLQKLLMDLRTALLESGQGQGRRPPQATARCQALSNTAWSLATLSLVDLALLRVVVDHAQANFHSFKPFELSTTLWALAKLGAVSPPVRRFAAPFFDLAAEHMTGNTQSNTFRILATITWAFATARVHNQALYHSLCSQMLLVLSGANPQEMANVAWACATVGVRHDQLLHELGQTAIFNIYNFKAQELSIMIWAFAAVGFFHEALFASVVSCAIKMNLQAQQLANILWALTRLRPRHRTTRITVLALLPTCTRLMGTLKPQELASVAQSSAKAFPRTQHTGTLPPQVIDFFVMAPEFVIPRLGDYSPQSLANIMTAFVTVKLGAGTRLFSAIGQETVRRAHDFESAVLLLLLRDLLRAPDYMCHHAARVLFAEFAERVDALSPKEYNALSRICARSLDTNACKMTPITDLAVHCRALAQIDKSLPTTCIGEHWGSEEPEDIDEDATEGEERKSEEEANEELAVAAGNRMSSSCPASAPKVSRDIATGADDEAEVESTRAGSDGLSWNRDPAFVWVVKNSFVHIKPQDEQDQGTPKSPGKPLPAPLDILPASISLEKLEAYRLNYQAFRTGKSIGAKGEVSDSVEQSMPLDHPAGVLHCL